MLYVTAVYSYITTPVTSPQTASPLALAPSYAASTPVASGAYADTSNAQVPPRAYTRTSARSTAHEPCSDTEPTTELRPVTTQEASPGSATVTGSYISTSSGLSDPIVSSAFRIGNTIIMIVLIATVEM